MRLSVGLVAVALVLLVGCGEDPVVPAAGDRPTSTGSTSPGATAHDGVAPSSDPPPVGGEGDVAPDQLAIAEVGAAVDEAVARAGGEVVSRDARIGITVARFPVASATELRERRDRLRAEGFDASVVVVEEDPTTGG